MRYVLECDIGLPIQEEPDLDELWTEGCLLTTPPSEPLVFVMASDDAREPAAMYDCMIPLWHDDLLKAVREAGVDNIEAFPAVLREAGGGREWREYWAVNVVGLVAALDFERSGLEGDLEEHGDLEAPDIVLDDAKAGSFLLFRLAESPDLIVVADPVRESIERHNIPGLQFLVPGVDE